MKMSGDKNCRRNGFSLLEVMIAVIVFCTATFTILALVSQSVQNVRRMQRPMIDVAPIDAQLSMTNKFVEGVTPPADLGDLLGDAYKGYTWTADIEEDQTNRLFHADIVIQRSDDKSIIARERLLYYKPDSPAGSMDGATVGGR
jgi:type II secretion system protein I